MDGKLRMFLFLVGIGFASSMLLSLIPWGHFATCAENGMVPDLGSDVPKCVELGVPNAFGELPSSDDYDFESLSGARCDDKPSMCYGTFHNGTEIQIQCDYVIHGCPPIVFGEYHVSNTLIPLKQYNSGVQFHEIQCKEGLQKTQRYDGAPACVKPETYWELIKRNWVSNIIKAIQSRDASEMYSSYMDKVIPTIDDFRSTLKESADIDAIFSKFGQPHDDIGSGLHIYEYVLNDSTKVWIGYSDVIQYVKHVDADGKILEDLYLYVKEPEPEPQGITDAEAKIRKAKDALETAYFDTVNLGNFYIRDVIVGFGTHGNTLVIDIPSKYIGTHAMDSIKQDVRHIVGGDVPVDYVLYDRIIERHISTVIPYLWNQILHQKGIEFTPKNQTYWNNSDGFADHDKVCSPIVASNGTELYISTTFDLEPFKITGTSINKTEPSGCHKIWKTDTIMTEPDRVTALWLKNQMMENEN